ncbi:MAG: hypothetical protein KGI54_14210 [Pseudomonadota bacterium]|nr:hypothetical protein [Pseudomonadota bacterium]
MTQLFANNVSVQILNTVNPGDTTITLFPGSGALLPAITGSNFITATLNDYLGRTEIITITAISGDNITVTRAQEGTTALTWQPGNLVDLRITRDTLVRLQNPAANSVSFDGTTLDQQFLNRVNRVVDSIAELKTISKLTYTRCFVTGYYSVGDGGGGVYYYDSTDNTSTDNGGTVIVATDGGRWKLVHNSAISICQFGAIGNNTVECATAIQNAINAAIAGNVSLYIPDGHYKISTALSITMSGTARGLKIQGDSGNDLLANTGAILDFSAISASDAVSVTSGNAQAFCVFSGITFVGSATVNHGIHVTNSSYVDFEKCIFKSFSQSGYAAVRFTGSAGGFVGVNNFDRCRFENNNDGIWIYGDNSNVYNIKSSSFLDSVNAAVHIGDTALVQTSRVINIESGCNFEGNARDVSCLAAVVGFNITGNYFENDNNAQTAPRILITNNGVNANSGALVIEGNTFQKTLVNAGDSMILLDSITKGRVKENFSATGNDNSKFFVYGTNCADVEFDVPHSPPGATPAYPVVMSRSGAGSVVTFTGPATSNDRVPITGLAFTGTGEAPPGASTTTINKAFYSRVGNQVTVTLQLTLTTKSGSSTGYVEISGLPFTNQGAQVQFNLIVSGFSRTGPYYYGIIPQGASVMQIWDSSPSQVDFQTFVTAGATLEATFTYFVNP